ncbi:MAG: hypothetical protein PUP46_03050 [Endozoicomonas sp. (ex Botrylloides leachii)]|nr:hypothetical protein [Endozoicomonas sp. (ex Botrylloides leachii)]
MTTVFIWNNNNIISRINTQLSHYTIGHSSLNITDNWGECQITLNPYVSWWGNGYSTPISDIVIEQVRNDMLIECYAPDHIIKIHNIKLDTAKMLSTWTALRTNRKVKYSMAFNNCADIASRILLAGVRSNFKFMHKRLVWTPLQVKRLAYSLGGRDVSWLYFMRELANDSDVPKPLIEWLQHESHRRSSRHGYKAAARPRFVKGIDTTKKPMR